MTVKTQHLAPARFLHRKIYPGEITVNVMPGHHPGEPMRPMGVAVTVNYAKPVSDEEAAAGCPRWKNVPIGHSPWYLSTKDSQPVSLNLNAYDGLPPRKAWAPVRSFLGGDVTTVLAQAAETLWNAFDPAASDPEDAERPTLQFRYADINDGHSLLATLAAYIGLHDGPAPVDAVDAAWAQFRALWNQAEGEVNVPGQLAWYSTHGPTEPGETQADYDREVDEFVALVSAGREATR